MIKKKMFAFLISLIIFKYGYSQNVRYNEVYAVACHNCYQLQYGSSIPTILTYTANIEIDIFDRKSFINNRNTLPGDWYVRHNPLYGKIASNCCRGTFRDCLIAIKEWINIHPQNEIIAVFIDKKEKWSYRTGSHKPEDIDKLITSVFSPEQLFTPAKLKGNEANIFELLRNGFWPYEDSLKGKIVFFITDGRIIGQRNKLLDQYIHDRKEKAICFVAPEIKNKSEISRPHGINEVNLGDIACYNLKYKYRNLLGTINSKKYLSRVYNAPENLDSYTELKKEKANFIALYCYRLPFANK